MNTITTTGVAGNSVEKQYAERDIMALDQAGGHYFRHVMAMTHEGLHSKSDIAAELGHRDLQIQQLTAQLEKAKAIVRAVASMDEDYACAIDNLEYVEERDESRILLLELRLAVAAFAGDLAEQEKLQAQLDHIHHKMDEPGYGEPDDDDDWEDED